VTDGPYLPDKADEDEILRGFMDFLRKEIEPIQEEVAPFFEMARYYDERGHEAQEISDARKRVRMAAAKAGYYNLFTPTSLGGENLGMQFFVRLTEALHEKYGPGEPREPLVNDAIANAFTGPGLIWEHVSDELRDTVLPRVLEGAWRGSFGLSEPDAGSDVWMMRTNAVRDGDDWVINGSKQWTSWVTDADFLFVFAVTNREAFERHQGGITCFYVPTDTPGYHLDSVIRLMGDVGGKEGITSYTDVRVPDAHRVGEVDGGLRMAFLTLTLTRLWLSARCVGEGRWALNQSLEYAKTRRTFGTTISEHQMVQQHLAQMAIDLYSAHTATIDCARRADRGQDVRLETSIVKYHGVNAGARVFDRAMQVHGGMGLTQETRLIDGWRFARASRITEGSDEITQRNIALHLLRKGLSDWS
jgi:acyl-CoA dehydrogenase